MYTQQSAKNSLEGRGNYIGQDDIQAHFHLLCDHDIPILHVGNTEDRITSSWQKKMEPKKVTVICLSIPVSDQVS